jgi:hypothetical protein
MLSFISKNSFKFIKTNTSSLSHIILIFALALIFPLVSMGGTTTAFVTSTTPGAARNDFAGWLGMKITVGASPMTVTDLGRYMLSGKSQMHRR